jgi:membrane protein implicated in regulation of membrane protease activity
MADILLQFNDPVGWLVLAGAALQAGACIFTNQLVLRAMLLTGSVHYLAYYSAVADTPLWPAITGTSVMALANAIGMLRVMNKRRRERRKEASASGRLRADAAENCTGVLNFRFAQPAGLEGRAAHADGHAPARQDCLRGPSFQRSRASEIRI